MGACAGNREKPNTGTLAQKKAQLPPQNEVKAAVVEALPEKIQHAAPIIQKLEESKPQWNEQIVHAQATAEKQLEQKRHKVEELVQELPISSARKAESKIKSYLAEENEVVPDQSNLGFHNAHVPPSFVISV